MIQLRDPSDTTKRKGRATVPINDGLSDDLAHAKAGALTNFVIEWAGRPVKSIKRGLKAAGVAIGRPDVSLTCFVTRLLFGLRKMVTAWKRSPSSSATAIAGLPLAFMRATRRRTFEACGHARHT